jgi:hypothetical protein
VSFEAIYAIMFGTLLLLMLILVARAIWKLDDDGIEVKERLGLVQRIWEALWR